MARTLRRHGEVFLVDVFRGDEHLARAVNQLLVVGFYLVNFGYLSISMGQAATINTVRHMMEVLSRKAGTVALVVGVLHYANVWFLNVFRRRATASRVVRPGGSSGTLAAPTPGS